MAGKWERFYGFVGRYQMEKVPAAELEFEKESGATNVTPAISGSIETPRRPVGEDFSFGCYDSEFIAPGARLPIQVKVRNHSALDQALPGSIVLPTGASSSLPPGIHLSLSYSERVPVQHRDYSDPPFDYGAWREVPMRAEVRIVTDQGTGPVLFPGQNITVLDIDLQDYFDLSRAGSYRLRTMFQVPGQAACPSNEISFSIAP